MLGTFYLDQDILKHGLILLTPELNILRKQLTVLSPFQTPIKIFLEGRLHLATFQVLFNLNITLPFEGQLLQIWWFDFLTKKRKLSRWREKNVFPWPSEIYLVSKRLFKC